LGGLPLSPAENPRPVLGLTGAYCAGKNVAAGEFERRGWEVIDVDRVGHRVVAEKAAEITAEFGRQVAADDGGIDRRALGEMVFSDRRKLRRLEAIVHPEMTRITAEQAAASRAPGVCINAALLFPMGLHTHCTAVIMVRAPLLQRMRRARQRDGLGYLQIAARFMRQRKLFPKHLLRDVDIYSVRNSGTPAEMEAQVAELIDYFER
jgi:dephospho-CoA kinase